MHNIKYFSSIFIILIMSIFFISLSYSKESTNIINNTLSDNNDNLVITASLGTNFTLEDETTNNISIINHNVDNISYYIILKAYNNLDNIYISIDSNPEEKYLDEIIYEGELSSYGTEGDYKYHDIKINAPEGTHFKIDVIKKQIITLKDQIIKNSHVYKENNNYRYYGLNVNNYLTYNNKLYRIIGIIDNKVKLLSEQDYDSSYNTYLNYLSLEDYLKSFNNSIVTIDNSINYDSWLNTESPYWLQTPKDYINAYIYDNVSGIILTDKYYTYPNRTTTDIESNLLIINGLGTIDKPYEVSYES